MASFCCEQSPEVHDMSAGCEHSKYTGCFAASRDTLRTDFVSECDGANISFKTSKQREARRKSVASSVTSSFEFSLLVVCRE